MTYSPKRKQPESLRFRAVTPSLTVNDISRSLAWYTKVLGFTVEERYEHEGKLGGASLVAGDVRWFLSQDDFTKGKDRPKGVGMRFVLETVQDLDQLATAIKARGGVLAGEVTERPWGTRDFTILDPDGFRLTITHRESDEA